MYNTLVNSDQCEHYGQTRDTWDLARPPQFWINNRLYVNLSVDLLWFFVQLLGNIPKNLTFANLPYDYYS